MRVLLTPGCAQVAVIAAEKPPEVEDKTPMLLGLIDELRTEQETLATGTPRTPAPKPRAGQAAWGSQGTRSRARRVHTQKSVAPSTRLKAARRSRRSPPR